MQKLDRFALVSLIYSALVCLLLLLRYLEIPVFSDEFVELLRNVGIGLMTASAYRLVASKELKMGAFALSLLAAVAFSRWNPTGLLMLPEAVRWLALGAAIFYALHKGTLTTWIFVSMLIGIEIGYDHKPVALEMQVLSKIFIKLIKTIVAPLLFGTLVVGIAGHANIKQVGRMGWKALLYFEVVTTIALFIGWGAINLTHAGKGIDVPVEELRKEKEKTFQEAKANSEKQKSDHTTMILDVFPENIAKSVAEGKVLQIVIFSVLFGIALSMLSQEKRAPMIHFAESLSEGMFKFTNIIMYYAPIGVGAAIAVTIAHMGLDVLGNLLWLLGTLYAALCVLLLLLLGIALYIKLPIRRFIQTIAEPVSIAFATTSSDAALPKAIEKLSEFGIPKKIIAFVLPTGYTFNLDGTTLYLSLASIFVAQAAGIEMTTGQQLAMLFTLMLTSKGVAAVPRASLVILFGTASSFGLPEWPIYLILGIDELMDMARTAVNIIGNCLATVVIAKWEGEWEPEAN